MSLREVAVKRVEVESYESRTWCPSYAGYNSWSYQCCSWESAGMIVDRVFIEFFDIGVLIVVDILDTVAWVNESKRS